MLTNAFKRAIILLWNNELWLFFILKLLSFKISEQCRWIRCVTARISRLYVQRQTIPKRVQRRFNSARRELTWLRSFRSCFLICRRRFVRAVAHGNGESVVWRSKGYLWGFNSLRFLSWLLSWIVSSFIFEFCCVKERSSGWGALLRC